MAGMPEQRPLQSRIPLFAAAGSCSPPASSCSAASAVSAVNSHSAEAAWGMSSASIVDQAALGPYSYVNNQGPADAAAAAANASGIVYDGAGCIPHVCCGQNWLYKLVTFPAYFTPCHRCCSNSRAPKREQLMTLFDIQYPDRVYCSHCPETKVRNAAALLQVRRSAFKDVVKALDICRYGTDIAGVQQYTLNGSKVIYLNREQSQDKKPSSASAAPAMCVVDGRAMMDKASQYCSLKCKLQAEDQGFVSWLNEHGQALHAVSQPAPLSQQRNTSANKRIGPHASSGNSTGLHRPPKAARTGMAGSAAAAAGAPARICGYSDMLSNAGPYVNSTTAMQEAQGYMQQPAVQGYMQQTAYIGSTTTVQAAHGYSQPTASSWPGFGNAVNAAAAPAAGTTGFDAAGTPFGLQPIKTSMSPVYQAVKAPAAVSSALLGPSTTQPCHGPGSLVAYVQHGLHNHQVAAVQHSAPAKKQQQLQHVPVSMCSWLPAPADLDSALSTNESWDVWQNDSAITLPTGAGLDKTWEHRSSSPALIDTLHHSVSPSLRFGSSNSSCDWLLDSPCSGTLAIGGIGAALMDGPVDKLLLDGDGSAMPDSSALGCEVWSGAALLFLPGSLQLKSSCELGVADMSHAVAGATLRCC